jgi:hypothetical protein
MDVRQGADRRRVRAGPGRRPGLHLPGALGLDRAGVDRPDRAAGTRLSGPGCAASSKARSCTCGKSPASWCRSRSTDPFEPAFDAAGASRPAAISSNCRPSPSRTASPPLKPCHGRTMTSQYFGSSSISRACRPALSQAMSVEPEPPNGSSTASRLLLEFRIARSISANRLHRRVEVVLSGLVEETRRHPNPGRRTSSDRCRPSTHRGSARTAAGSQPGRG